MIFIYDNSLQVIDEIGKEDIVSADKTEQLNNQWTIDVSIPYEKYNKEMSYLGFKYQDNFFIYKVISTKREKHLIHLTGIHLFFHELKGQVVRDRRFTDSTAQAIIQATLDETDWILDIQTSKTASTNFYHIASLEAFYQAIKLLGVEFELNIQYSGSGLVKTVVVRDFISRDKGKWYEYGDKLVSVIAEENHGNVITAFIGRGKGIETTDEEGNVTGGYSRKIKFDEVEWSTTKGNPANKPKGQDYIEIEVATRLYGYPNGKPRIGVIDFDDIEDSSELLQKTYEYALEESRPKLQLKASAIDDESVEIGEVATVIRPDLDIRYKTRIFKVTTNLLNDVQSFEFGDKVVVGNVERLKAIQEKTNHDITAMYQVINSARTSADGKSTIFVGPDRPTYANDNDLWYRENPDGTVDMLIFKDGDFAENISDRLFKELNDKLTESAEMITQAKAAADKAVADTQALDIKIDNLGDLSGALVQLDEAQARLSDLEIQISEAIGNISADFYDHAPTPPYDLHQKWYKTHYIPSLEIDQGYDTINQEDNVTLDEFANPGLFICINPRAEGDTFHWNDWKRIATDNTSILLTQIADTNKAIEDRKTEIQSLYSELLKKANQEDLKIVTDEVDRQGLLIAKVEEDNGLLTGKVNDIQNTADESRQTLATLIGEDENGNLLVGAYNTKIATALDDIQELYQDLDPNNPNSTAYVLNETKKTADATVESLKSYAKSTDLEGLATESYAQTQAKTEAGKVQSLLTQYAKSTDLNGLATETYALTVATQEAGKVQTLLQGYAKTEDLNGYTTREQLNSSISTVNSNISSLSTKVDDEITKINTLTSTVDGNSRVIADLLGETGNKSLSTIRNLIDEHSTTLMSLPDNVTGFVTTDDTNLPIPPYKKGWLWNKEEYDFTQGWDLIDETDTITLAEFAEAGQWICVNDRASGEFDWNDFERVSADQQGQISQVYQDLNSWAVTLKNYQTDTTTKLGVIEGSISQTVRKGDLIGQINTEAGNILIQASGDGKTSRLNLTKEGAYMDTAFIESAHLGEGIINTAHIGDLTFDWAVGKTLNAELVNIINLNANNITGNKTQFVQSVWNSLSSSVSIESLGMRLRNQSLNWSAYLGASGMEFKDDLTSTPVGVLRATMGTDGHANGVHLIAERGYNVGLGYRNLEGQLRSMAYVDNDVNGNAKLKLNNDLFSLGNRFKFVFDSVDDNMALIVSRGAIANQPSLMIRNPKAPNGVGGTLYIGDDGIVRVLNADGNGYKTLN